MRTVVGTLFVLPKAFIVGRDRRRLQDPWQCPASGAGCAAATWERADAILAACAPVAWDTRLELAFVGCRAIVPRCS